MHVEIDNPFDRCLTKASGTIIGWFATRGSDLPEEYEFRVGPLVLPHRSITRPDMEGAMPGYSIVGFEIKYDLVNYLAYINELKLVIQLKVDEYHPLSLRITVKECALAMCLALAGGV